MMHENMVHVKKFVLVPMISGLLISLMSFAPARHHHRSSEVQDSSEVTVQDDSILPVIAWFSKRDTMTYWIHDNQWEVNGKDTVMTLGAAAKVMLTVTDSTRNVTLDDHNSIWIHLQHKVNYFLHMSSA